MPTVEAFDAKQFVHAKRLLAAQVSLRMGRKYEEGDWSGVYETVKSIPRSNWSNLSIDIMWGNLGVEHKMLCRPQDRPILTECGLDLMHPAGTRAIRIPAEQDATLAARDILAQYGHLIQQRTITVATIHRYQHSLIDRTQALAELVGKLKYGRDAAEKLLPIRKTPHGDPEAVPDMRLGWLLWKTSLDEFLYFEEPMSVPDPSNYVAEWRESGGGRRLASRNLWVYDQITGRKVFSITTSAGAKIQPYFRVPLPHDPHLYHFAVQGEKATNGNRIMWLQRETAEALQALAGGLDAQAIAQYMIDFDFTGFENKQGADNLFLKETVRIEVPDEVYTSLRSRLKAVSDEHAIQILTGRN